MTLKYIWRSFSLGCHFHIHFSFPWHAFVSHGLPAIAELLVWNGNRWNTSGINSHFCTFALFCIIVGFFNQSIFYFDNILDQRGLYRWNLFRCVDSAMTIPCIQKLWIVFNEQYEWGTDNVVDLLTVLLVISQQHWGASHRLGCCQVSASLRTWRSTRVSSVYGLRVMDCRRSVAYQHRLSYAHFICTRICCAALRTWSHVRGWTLWMWAITSSEPLKILVSCILVGYVIQVTVYSCWFLYFCEYKH